MALAFVVEPAVDSIRIEIPVPAGVDTLALSRMGPSRTKAYVRGWTASHVTPSTTVFVRDFEAPIGVPLTYTAEVWAAATPGTVTTITGTVTIPSQGCNDNWLTDLVRAANSQRVILESLDELEFGVPVGVHRILNRRSPITTSDISWTPTFELDFLTDTDAQKLQVRDTLGTGVPVLLRTPPENGVGSMYFTVTDWSEQRIGKGTLQARRWVVEGVQVDRPDPTVYAPLAPATYETVLATFADYADMLASRDSYDAVLYDYMADLAPTSPWPPSDV